MAVVDRRVAVIGSGISGLSSAWLLNRSGAKVTLFEKEETCGGHTLTDDSSTVPIDLGFQVYNLTTYPHLIGFLEHLGVDTEPSDMSFSLSVDDGALEWSSDNVFAQPSNLLSLPFLRMLFDVIRFGRSAPEVIAPKSAAQFAHMSLRSYLKLRGYGPCFIRNYLLPMCAAVWSAPNNAVLEFPVQTLVRFWVNHHLLDIFQRPRWRVVKGRSRSYVNRVLEELDDVRLGCAVEAVRRLGGGGVEVVAGGGRAERFDAVVLATHTDVSLRILGQSATPEEREVLGSIAYNTNTVFLHTDVALMPRRRAAWTSWNYLGRSGEGMDDAAVCVSYWCNRLQNLAPELPDLLVTLNPLQDPAPEKTLRRLEMDHPVLNGAAIAAQQRLPDLQGRGGVYFAGAWAGYGFHEDGIKSAVAVARQMGADVPWTPISTSPKLSLTDQVLLWVFDRFARKSFRQGYLRLILPNGEELCYGSLDDVTPEGSQDAEWQGRPLVKAVVHVHDMRFFWKLLLRHDTGLGESYMEGLFRTDSLGGLMAVLTANARHIQDNRSALGPLNWLGERLLHYAHTLRENSREGSLRNIAQHYDAGNAMYKEFLDSSMTYSSGIHGPGVDLEAAQVAKLDALIAKADIHAGDRVLEIGCGWGSMAIRAAQTKGCSVVGVTLSKEQLEEAGRRVEAAGLQDRVQLLFCDYRDIPGEAAFDAVLSCEMVEAVGHANLPTYFATISRLLKPGGKAALQAICVPNERYEEYRAASDFIREHIFPGGHLPSVGVCSTAAAGTEMALASCEDIGVHYAVTLREWRQRWEEGRDRLLQLGYDEVFWRKYRFYFAYCEAAFDFKYIHNQQMVWTRSMRPWSETSSAAAASTVSAAGTAASQSGDVLSSSGGSGDSGGASSHALTQALMATYFLLAGVLMSQRAVLLIMPLTSAVLALLLVLSRWLCKKFVWPYKLAAMDAAEQVRLQLSVVHVFHSAWAGPAALMFVLSQRSISALLASPAASPAPDMLLAACAGFFAFQLWARVQHWVFGGGAWRELVQYTLLLCVSSASVYKGFHTPLLAALMVAELASLADHLDRVLAVMAGAPSGAASRAKISAFFAFRLAPHAALAAAALLQPHVFANATAWVLAVVGLVGCNTANVVAARFMLSVA